MTKAKKTLFSFSASGSLGKIISIVKRKKVSIVEHKPIPVDAKSPAQLSWRHMYQKAVALWHALSPAEQQEWESQARRKHMTGFAWFMSQCLKPNPGIYLPLQGGTMQGDIDLDGYKITNLPQPVADQEPATKKYVDDYDFTPSLNQRTTSLTFIIDGGGSAITTGEKGHLQIPFAGEIKQVTLLADLSGSIVIDIWKDTYANFPPTNADSITASAPPTISSAQKSQDSTLTGWTKAIVAGDILAFNVDSCATITRLTLSLKVEKS